MGHFAKVLDGQVVNVIVAEPEFFETFVDNTPGEWIKTSYNTYGNQHPNGSPLRGNYAGVGFTYDRDSDVFYAPKPFPSWSLNRTTWLWEAPSSIPDSEIPYFWDEPTLSWKPMNQPGTGEQGGV